MQIQTLLQEECSGYLARYTENQQKVILDYWESICFTRKTGRISVNIMKNEMAYWAKFKQADVISGLEVHIGLLIKEKYSYKEDYTRGIIRNIANSADGDQSKQRKDGSKQWKDQGKGVVENFQSTPRDLSWLVE